MNTNLASSDAKVAAELLRELAERLDRYDQDVKRAANRIEIAFRVLSDLTTDEFALGGDRPAREELVEAMLILGRDLDPEIVREYQH